MRQVSVHPLAPRHPPPPPCDMLTAHPDPNAYTVVATYSEAMQPNSRRQRRSGAASLTDRVTEQERPTTSVSIHEQTKQQPTQAHANIGRQAEQLQWNRDDADGDEDELWALVTGKKLTGKKAVMYVGNLKIGANEVLNTSSGDVKNSLYSTNDSQL